MRDPNDTIFSVHLNLYGREFTFGAPLRLSGSRMQEELYENKIFGLMEMKKCFTLCNSMALCDIILTAV